MEGADGLDPVAQRRPLRQCQRRPVHVQRQVPGLQARGAPQNRLQPSPTSHRRLENTHQGRP